MKVLYIKRLGGFYSVHVNEKCVKGEVVHTLSDKIKLHKPTRTSLQISEDLHVEDDMGRYINHSCDPTCEIIGYDIVVIRDIPAYYEITFNYKENETKLSSPFKCDVCGVLIESKDSLCVVKLGGDK